MKLLKTLVRKMRKMAIIDIAVQIRKGKMISSWVLDRKIQRYLKVKELPDKEIIPNLIVSLTTYPARIEIVKYSIYSLLQQTVTPAKLFLWLAKEEFPGGHDSLPDVIKAFEKKGLEIRFSEYNFRSYDKFVHTIREYPESMIVTADDDLYYNSQWLEILYKKHTIYPNDVIAHRVHSISFDNGKIDSYTSWNGPWVECSFFNFLTSGAGVLFPPHSLFKDVTNNELFTRLSPLADDIWFYVMTILNNTRIRRIKNRIRPFIYIDKLYHFAGLMDENVLNGKNDEQLKSVLTYYNLYDGFYERFSDLEESIHEYQK
jgi:hypothetical protein